MSNSPALLNTFNSVFSQGKIQSTMKILGIHFSFSPKEMKMNWDKLTSSLLTSTLSKLNPNDSIYSKVISINQNILPPILFLARVIPPTPKHIKTITFKLFKFLWSSPFEPLKRSSIYLPRADGGLFFPSIGSKCLTAISWQIIYLLKSSKPFPQFWMALANYNLGSKIRLLNPSLYSNSEPHRPSPSNYYKKIFSTLSKLNLPTESFQTLTFKALYLHILKPDSIPSPQVIGLPNPNTWLKTTLFHPFSSHFSFFEKEIAFRTARNGFVWGCFFLTHKIFSSSSPVTKCKLCSAFTDHPHHLFFECSIAKFFLSRLRPTLSQTCNQPLDIPKQTILYNISPLTGKSLLLTLKLSSLIRLALFNLRKNRKTFQTHITPKLLQDTLYKIRSKFKSFTLSLDP